MSRPSSRSVAGAQSGRHRHRFALCSRRHRLHSFVRNWLSRMLNFAMRRMLSMPVRDMSSGFRLYRREALADLEFEAPQFRSAGGSSGQGLRAGL